MKRIHGRSRSGMNASDNKLVEFCMDAIRNDDRAMLEWCQTMERNGCALVKTDNAEGQSDNKSR